MPASTVSAADTAHATDSTGRVTTASGLLALSLYWIPTNIFWTVMLQNFLPARVQQMVGSSSEGLYLLFISGAGAIATTLVQLIVGPISDASGHRMGRRHPFLIGGTLIAALFVFWFAWAQTFIPLMIAFFGIQLFVNAATGPYQALMPDNVPPSRHGVASAFMGVALLIGQLVGAMVLFGMAFLKTKPSMLSVLVGIVLLMILGMIITVLLVPDAPAPVEDQKSPGEALSSLTRLGIHEYPDFFLLLLSRFCINLSYSTVTAFLLYYLQDAIGPHDKATMNQGLVIVTATLSGLLGTVIAGRFADRVPKKRLVYIACAILAASALFFGFVHTMPVVLVLAFTFGAGWGAFSAVDWALAVNLLPRGKGAARYMAVWHACLTLPQVFAPMLGPVADRLNVQYGHGFGWRAAMLSTIVYLVIGAWVLDHVRERPIDPAEG